MSENENNDEPEVTDKTERNGRTAQIEIAGYYKVQVWGDPEDSLSDVIDEVAEAADRATEEIEKLNEATDSDDKSFG